jgi:hypothetical protein
MALAMALEQKPIQVDYRPNHPMEDKNAGEPRR